MRYAFPRKHYLLEGVVRAWAFCNFTRSSSTFLFDEGVFHAKQRIEHHLELWNRRAGVVLLFLCSWPLWRLTVSWNGAPLAVTRLHAIRTILSGMAFMVFLSALLANH